MICSTHKTQSLQQLLNDNFYGKHIPIDGMIELTHKCNFRCIHCYGKNERTNNDMSYEQIISILEQVHKLGCLSIAFTGGEALCRPDFTKIYLKAKEMGFMVILLSNASLITEELAKLFYDYPLGYFSTTMYGASKKTYEVITGNSENYNKFINGINLLDKYRIPIELKAIALKENYNDIEKIYNFACKRKYIFRCSVTIRSTNEGDSSTQNHSITVEQMLKLDTEILKNRVEFWKSVALLDDTNLKVLEKCKHNCKYLCNAGENNFVIDASGNVHICASERRYGFSLANYSFEECWNKLLPMISAKRVTEKFQCLSCKYISYCEQCSALFDIDIDGAPIIPKGKCDLAKKRYNWCENYRQEHNCK